jgi:hypothetical protein
MFFQEIGRRIARKMEERFAALFLISTDIDRTMVAQNKAKMKSQGMH